MKLRIRKSLSISLKDNSSAFGYSITITGAYAVLESFAPGSPDLLEIFVGAGGATLAFIVVEVALHFLGRDLASSDTEQTRIAARMLAFVSIGCGMGIATLCGWLLHGAVAWFAAGFLATTLFVLLDALQLALVEQETDRRD